MHSRYFISLLATAFLAVHWPAAAEDIDLFLGAGGDSDDKPNVLLVIDTAANFSANAAGSSCIIKGKATALSGTTGGIEQCALYKVIGELEDDSVNVGVMTNNGSNVVNYLGVACLKVSSQPGGCLLYPITRMTAANKVTLLAWIEKWKTSGKGDGYVKADGKANGAMMQEAWAYYAGKRGLSNVDYSGIKPASTCQNNFVVFIGNSFNSSGSPGDQTGKLGPKDALEGTNALFGGSMNASPAATAAQKVILNNTITTSCGTVTLGNPHENNGYYADEWTRYMRDQKITTYAIGLLGASCQASYSGLLSNMATVGGGKYFATTNYDELVLALQATFADIQSVNSVFASVSLPVSVNQQGLYLNQVFIGMFRPDADALPRWAGNLKQYRLEPRDTSIGGKVVTTLKLVDAKTPADLAISSAGTGFIDVCARSYWTPTADDTYWTPMSLQHCAPHAATSNTPDGNIVEKGAQGYELRNGVPANRNVMTCDAACGSVLAAFNDADATLLANADLGADAAERAKVINWTRGLNNRGDENFVAATDMRPSSHGDVVHSRPVAINYGTDDARQIVVFYGGNDGVLRAINGNRATDIGTVAAGDELWSFVAPESYSAVKRLRDNKVQVRFQGSAEGQPKQYGMDGPIATYRAGGDTWIFTAMRRGGRELYAFDVSDLASDPSSPSLMWKKGCPHLTDDTGCSAGMSDIGQTWSPPVPMKAEGYNEVISGTETVLLPMLIMGGGYDACEDADVPDADCKSSGKGNGIYLLDAEDGHLINFYPTERPVVGDVVVVEDTATGNAMWAYAADLGGNVYRLSGTDINTPFGSTAPIGWNITKIADLGCADTAACASNRKFMFGPDVVEKDGTYYILVGSGDREKPLKAWPATLAVENQFFMIQDRPTDDEWLSDELESGHCADEVICLGSLVGMAFDDDPPSAEALADSKGWYLGMREGEQVVTSAITVFGTTTFSTHTPTDPEDICEPDLGKARVYNIDYLTSASTRNAEGKDRSVKVDGGGLPPSPVAGKVKLDDGSEVPFIIGSESDSPLQGNLPQATSPVNQPKGWTYWYVEK